MVFVGSYYTVCDGRLKHSNGEASAPNGPCEADHPSTFVILYQEQCESIAEPPPIGSTPTIPGTPGDTPGGGGETCPDCPPTEPTECIQIPTDPTDPSTGIGENGCTPVLPIIPILTDPKPQTPCDNTKTLMQRPEIKAHTKSLDSQSKAKNEKGYKVSITGVVSPLIDGEEHRVNLGSATGQQGGGHNHTPDGIKMFSATDIGAKLLSYVVNYQESDYQNAFFQMVGSDASGSCPGGWCYRNYIIRFTGNAQDLNIFLNANYDFKELINQQKRRELYLQTNSSNTVSPYSNILTNEGLEKPFL